MSSTEQNLPFSGGDGDLEEAHYNLFRVSPEPDTVHLAVVLITTFIVIFGMSSAFIKEKLYAGEAIIATLVGIAFGPYGASLFNPRSWGGGEQFSNITLEFCRLVIALSVFAVGVELPRAYMLKHWRSLIILLGPVMFFGWLISGALMYGLIPGIDFLQALVMAAAVTPTDPILAASVVGKGKFASDHVPSHIRHLLQSESGSNDGAAFPFLYLAMFILLRDGEDLGKTIGAWIYLVLLYQIILGVFVGAAIGVIARKTMKFAKRRALIDRESMVAMYIALALFSTSVTTLFGSDDLLAAFACGSAFAWDDWFTESIEESNFSAIIDLLVNSAVFFYVGATIPFDAWSSDVLTLTPWRLIVLGLCILLVRRLPSVFLLQRYIPDIHTSREAIFCGWFGPMGIGALFISSLATERLPTPNIPPQNSLDILTLTVQPVTYFIIMISILAHGLSIPFFRLSRRVHSISRTWTSNSNTEGPSWLTRVRRVGDPRDVIVNRDDAEKAELGEGGVDLGTDVDADDFADEKSSSDINDQKDGSSPSDTLREEDEEDPDSADSAKEKHYPDKEECKDVEIVQEGDEVVIDRKGGEDVEEIKPDGEHKREEAHVPSHEDGPVGRLSRGFSASHIGPALSNRFKHFTTTGAPSRPPQQHAHFQPGVKDEHDEEGPVGRLSRGFNSAAHIGPALTNRIKHFTTTGAPLHHPPQHAQLDPGKAAKKKKANDEDEDEDEEEEEDEQIGPMLRGTNRGFSTASIGPALANRLRGFSIGTPYDPSREDEYKKERHDCRDSRDDSEKETKRWIEGKRVVIERKNGEVVEVIDEAPSEQAQKDADDHPHRQVMRLPGFLSRRDSQAGPGKPTPQLSAYIRAKLADEANSPKSRPPNLPPTARATSPKGLPTAETGSSGLNKGKEKAADQDAPQGGQKRETSEMRQLSTEPISSMRPRQEDPSPGGLQLHERIADRSGTETVRPLKASESPPEEPPERGRDLHRDDAPSVANSRNPSPSRAAIRFDVPTTTTERSGFLSRPLQRPRGKPDLRLKRS